MNIVSSCNDNSKRFIEVMNLSNRKKILFLKKVIQMLPWQDASNLRSVCKAISPLKIKIVPLKTHVVEQWQSEQWRSFLERRFNIIWQLLGSDVVMKYYDGCAQYLKEFLVLDNYIYAEKMIEALVQYFRSEESEVDDIVIDILSLVSCVENKRVRGEFLRHLLQYSEDAFSRELKGRELLKGFTIEIINSLNEQDKDYFIEVVKGMRKINKKNKSRVASLGDKNVFKIYEELLRKLGSAKKKKGIIF